jgi:hypothetical protein
MLSNAIKKVGKALPKIGKSISGILTKAANSNKNQIGKNSDLICQFVLFKLSIFVI